MPQFLNDANGMLIVVHSYKTALLYLLREKKKKNHYT